MNKLKIVLGYLFSFIAVLVFSVTVLLLIIRFTICDEKYLQNSMHKNDYYGLVSQDIKEEMEDFMTSSGLSKEVLDNIYTEEELREDIDNYFNGFYVGEKHQVVKEELKSKLLENVNTYLKENNFQITDSEEMTSFIDEMAKIYQKKITLYGSLDGYTKTFFKLNSVVNIMLISSIVFFLILLFLIIRILKVQYWHAIFIAVALILLFLRLFILEKIDIENILLFSESFSKILKHIITNISSLLWIISIILLVVGILLSFVFSLCQARKKKEVNH